MNTIEKSLRKLPPNRLYSMITDKNTPTAREYLNIILKILSEYNEKWGNNKYMEYVKDILNSTDVNEKLV